MDVIKLVLAICLVLCKLKWLLAILPVRQTNILVFLGN